MDIVQISIIGIIAAVLSMTLRKQVPEFALLLAVAASVVILFALFTPLSVVVGTLGTFGDRLSIRPEYIRIIVRVIGVAYITEFSSQLCADAGEGAIAQKIELGGKLIIMAMATPVLINVVDIITTG
jgi:stage III sporulation protein AD